MTAVRRSPRAFLVVLLAMATWCLMAILVWRPMLWPDFSTTIMNDGDTALYSSYALNLTRCPLSATHGLFTDAVGQTCEPTLRGKPYTHYLDHPSGMAWILAPFVRGEQPLLAARLVEITITGALVLACSIVALRSVGPAAAIGVLVASSAIPLLWFHAIVINLQQAASLFSVLVVGCFLEYEVTKRRVWLQLSLVLFAVGGWVDWPVYFLGAPIGLWLLWSRRWRDFTLFLLVGLTALVSVFASFVMAPNSSFDVARFFKGTFIDALDTSKGPHLVPFKIALVDSFRLMRKTMQAGILLLWLALALSLLPAARRRFGPLPTLFISCFLAQGAFNQILFHQWAASHNYWGYYYLPALMMAGGLLASWLAGAENHGLARPAVVALCGCLVVAFCWRHQFGWREEYRQPPVSDAAYLRKHGLEALLARDTILIAEDARPYFHQGFKLRLVFARSLVPPDQARGLGCENAFSIFQASSLLPARRQQLPPGTLLDRYDWYVIPGNAFGTCLAARLRPGRSGAKRSSSADRIRCAVRPPRRRSRSCAVS